MSRALAGVIAGLVLCRTAAAADELIQNGIVKSVDADKGTLTITAAGKDLVDHVTIKGVNFHCNGAVCGSWWKGPNGGVAEGYALLDLYDDGSNTCEYVGYGWKADPPPPAKNP